jgi:hypothetical protein
MIFINKIKKVTGAKLKSKGGTKKSEPYKIDIR